MNDPATLSAEEPPAALWEPSAERNRRSVFAGYLAWLRLERGLEFSGYRDAWEWSSTAIEEFWASVWDFFEVRASCPYERVLAERRMPAARWFDGTELNYAEHAFRHAVDSRPALLYGSETRPLTALSWAELERRVGAVAASLAEMGVRRGNRVAGYLPNAPEALVAFLACAALGAVWTCCSPELRAAAVADRFRQIEPRVLIAVDGYTYGGEPHDRRELVAELRRALPTLEHTVLVPYLDPGARLEGTVPWERLLARPAPLRFQPLAFDHPLWILYSSGTTGAPKAIVHGHGGILLEHLKAHALQNDLRPGDRFFWFTTTGWMMWNLLPGALLAGGTPVLYDGSASFPDAEALWRLAEEARITRFGASAAYFTACMEAGLRPGERFDLGALLAVGSTGSPLPPAAFRWVYGAVKRDVWLASSSGGTDVCTAFLCGCPFLPVYEGELQGPALGVRAAAYDDAGRPIVGAVGELVITEPLPSMPLYFWNDREGERYRESYFDVYPGVWRHGDWVSFSSRGSAVIHGRSDATLNRGGVRIGSSEIYRAVEAVPEVVDSLVVGLELPDGGYHMPLFVVLRPGTPLDDRLRERIRRRIRAVASPRHLPDEIVQVPAVPRTLTGKKLEVPIKRILLGAPPESVVDPGALSEPESLRFFIERAANRVEPR